MARCLSMVLIATTGASAFQASAPSGALRRAVAVEQPLVVMRGAPVEEKKGFSLFGMGQKQQVKGKVVPTGKKGEEEMDESKKLLQQVKDAGVAGIISYIFWEWAFWGVSVPVCIFGYQAATGHWPDFSNQDDLAKLGAEAFAFVNVARFAVPLRIGLALSTTPWVQSNIVDKFQKDKK